ncbi:hypothetical protein GGX14DRAFT_651370 [Mycena pura]|uniref:Uncharacterized protein n=1 Tax=Mycena pura TaxID=153505 RepID=A0AAD6YNY6_9AGAR|nr:hypothetical protein GGX14DRAFT_651370 [Mycena pura]
MLEGDWEKNFLDPPTIVEIDLSAGPLWPRFQLTLLRAPAVLSTLFSGTPERMIGRPAWRLKVVSEEALYMELLAAEHSDKAPDAGALEGSGDDYEAQFSYYHIGN